MTTNLSSGSELRNKILEGVEILADYVASTLGPRGQNVLIHKENENPFITKDGVTVARNISFEDPFMNAGAEIVKQVSSKTNTEAGDGTTTSTVLTRSIIKLANKHISSGAAPIEIKRGLDKCLVAAIEEIKEVSKPISSESDIKHVATISANNDKVIGNLIASAVTKVGQNGSVTIEEARSLETSLDLVEGFKFSSGYLSNSFVTEEKRSVARYEEPIFLVTDYKIEFVKDILPALELAARENRPLVIIAESVEGQALSALVMNSIRGTMKVAAVKAPFYGEERRSILEDISTTTGAKFFKRSNGDKISEISLTDFGQSRTVEISKFNTTIVDGKGEDEKILQKINSLKEQVKSAEDMSAAATLQARVTRLSSGVAIIRVGASTEVEMIEKKHRIVDALEAVRSAQQEGIVPGGGITYLRISDSIALDFENQDQALALQIFKKALKSPFIQMAVNSGLSPDLVMRDAQTLAENEGINFATGKRQDLFESGVIDPAKVTRCALKNAVSAASTLLLTNHSIVVK